MADSQQELLDAALDAYIHHLEETLAGGHYTTKTVAGKTYQVWTVDAAAEDAMWIMVAGDTEGYTEVLRPDLCLDDDDLLRWFFQNCPDEASQLARESAPAVKPPETAPSAQAPAAGVTQGNTSRRLGG
jgi:hypothetical protein